MTVATGGGFAALGCGFDGVPGFRKATPAARFVGQLAILGDGEQAPRQASAPIRAERARLGQQGAGRVHAAAVVEGAVERLGQFPGGERAVADGRQSAAHFIAPDQPRLAAWSVISTPASRRASFGQIVGLGELDRLAGSPAGPSRSSRTSPERSGWPRPDRQMSAWSISPRTWLIRVMAPGPPLIGAVIRLAHDGVFGEDRHARAKRRLRHVHRVNARRAHSRESASGSSRRSSATKSRRVVVVAGVRGTGAADEDDGRGERVGVPEPIIRVASSVRIGQVPSTISPASTTAWRKDAHPGELTPSSDFSDCLNA